jgi:hypothetical protein
MLFGFFNRVSGAPQLKDALDVSAQRVRAIAQRVSAASVQGQQGFQLPDGTTGAPIDLEAEMTSLADEQLRQEATLKLLEGTYTRLRMSIRER